MLSVSESETSLGGTSLFDSGERSFGVGDHYSRLRCVFWSHSCHSLHGSQPASRPRQHAEPQLEAGPMVHGITIRGISFIDREKSNLRGLRRCCSDEVLHIMVRPCTLELFVTRNLP